MTIVEKIVDTTVVGHVRPLLYLAPHPRCLTGRVSGIRVNSCNVAVVD